MVKEVAVPPNDYQQQHAATDALVIKCPGCKEMVLRREWEKSQKVCSHCGYHFQLTAQERIKLLVDCDSFVETDAEMTSTDPLGIANKTQTYADTLRLEMLKTGLNEAVISGYAKIGGFALALAVMDFRFLGASMGSVVGEKIARTIELGIEKQLPVLVVTTSEGVRIYEGTFALMQMAKTSAALARLAQAHLPYFTLLTDPTIGSITASVAMHGDVVLAEPGALISFAGSAALAQYTHSKHPEEIINAELLVQRGMIDSVVHRNKLRETLVRLLRLYAARTNSCMLNS